MDKIKTGAVFLVRIGSSEEDLEKAHTAMREKLKELQKDKKYYVEIQPVEAYNL